MNICLANDSFPPLIDGVSNAVLNYASILQKSYGRAVVATPKYPDVEDRYPFEVVRYPSIDTRALVGYRAGYPFSYEAIHRLRSFQPDIIHSHCPIASTLLARQLREVTAAPVVFTYHTKFDIDIRNAIRGNLIQEAAIKAMVSNIEACDDIWVVSRGAGENLRKLGYAGEYTIMENGVDLPRTQLPPDALEALSREYALPENVPVFLFVGRIMWYKGLRIILDALSQLRRSGIPFQMVFVGDGGDFDEVRAYAVQKDLENVCLFTGAVRDRARITQWYCRADLFLFPSTFDTNGLVVHEAAACALASVLVRGSCAAEGTRDGVNCVHMEENADSLAGILSALAVRPDKIKALGQNASRDLYLSWEDSVARAYRRYEEVLRQGGSNHNRRAPDLLEDSLKALGELYRGIDEVRARSGAHRFHISAPFS